VSVKTASLGSYLLAYLALLLMAGVAIVFARAVPWPRWDLVIDLALATAMAGVVLWFFMHLAEASFQIRLGLGVAVSLLLTLLLLTVADVATRHEQPMAPRPGPGFGFYRR
jgi:caa(3)-type oxidase subunit IV